jgi:hypothetical protein
VELLDCHEYPSLDHTDDADRPEQSGEKGVRTHVVGARNPRPTKPNGGNERGDGDR